MTGNELFEASMKLIFRWEGGLSDHPEDPGGVTKYGICLRSYPELGRDGIVNLTKEQATDIYHKDYWPTVPDWMYSMHPATCILMMDAAVNQGPGFAKKALQRAVGAADDGIIGPDTKRKVLAFDDLTLAHNFSVQRAMHYGSLSTFKTFGKGWMNRLFSVHTYAILAIHPDWR